MPETESRLSGLALDPEVVTALEAVLPSLRLGLAQALLDAPPYEMAWMKDHPRKV